MEDNGAIALAEVLQLNSSLSVLWLGGFYFMFCCWCMVSLNRI